ncbi:BspA family leucine-rich repeat surface protein [Lactococcus formosensis]|uniref:BspA family leucine-rich repeat surface protein n=1 Tax=Lactococcus formosensis TaxID=1281486 RepID=UPI00289000DF|nr:BspA family leucine-rich repeat surface protein [Lactococcus formosensis]MDT2727209.1 BspA family leucine-rich repeat surface protein [Lactococcus formosensis]
MKQKNKFQRMVRFFCTLFIITFTFLFFMPLVSALDNDENMQQDDNSELQLSQDASIQTSSSQKNEVQTKNIASGKFGTSEWVIDNSGCLHIGEGTFAKSINQTDSPWHLWKEKITSIVFEGKVILNQDSSVLFNGLKNVKTISNFTNVDTSEVNSMDSMFRDMSSLEELDLSNFNTSKVTSMLSMFSGASSLRELDLSTFDTSKVKAMNYMFSDMTSITTLNVSKFKTEEVEMFDGMFRGMTSLINLDLSSFNTSKAKNMYGMFKGMISLKFLNLSSFSTSRLTSATMSSMFDGDDQLSQLVLGESFYFKVGVTLPEVPISDEYNGKWRNVASGTVDKPNGNNIWTSDELTKHYSGVRDADTYVWQKRSFITEYYYDTEGNSLKDPVVTEMDSMTFTPHPEKYEEVDDTLYIYKGWSKEPPESGASIHEGTPPPTTVEATYYYVYEKADKFINVTIPTEIVFGTENHSKKITSKKYEIKNNSNDVDLQMMLATFDKVNSDIQLLDEASPDPSGKENSARLDLLVGKTTLSSLNEKVSEQELGNIQSGKTTTLALTGTYFGDLSERHKVEYKTNLKFKAQAKVEN